MQRRVYLLFVLFVVVAAFYASVTRDGVPGIAAQQQAQTELFNQIEEMAMAPADNTVNSSGN